ncbi:MAG TPA: cytochrome c biogenesis protein CcdA [Candidatus Aquicultoraceae bacterium]|jgi:thiol:disulfide interchange protein DsbD|nr:cytochrome c biogenesis protein CcdA [Candidatus Aquicultoraceae bacterium]
MEPLAHSFEAYLQAGSVLSYAAAFAGGVMIGFTPCVYPVLPITVGYIGGRSRGSKARGFYLSLSYVLGMAATYAGLGCFAALSGQVFGQAAASPAANLVVGNVCILMALSMLDVFHVPVPAFVAGRAAGKKRGGAIGAFALGVSSGFIVGPCTAPVLGSLLVYVGARQNVLFGASLLFAFALGMGFLLLVAGTFTGLLASLPKSGKWTDAVKKGFGFFLILVGEYFLLEAGKSLV